MKQIKEEEAEYKNTLKGEKCWSNLDADWSKFRLQ